MCAAAMDWLDDSELRIGLGCMRLSTDADRDEEHFPSGQVESGETI